MASRVVYPPNNDPHDHLPRSVSPMIASSPTTRIRASSVFARRLSLTASSVANTVASSSLFGSSPPSSSSSIYQQSSFFRASSSHINSTPQAASSTTSISSPLSSSTVTSSSGLASPSRTSTFGRPRSQSTNHPPPPKYKTYRTPQLRISLQDASGNLVLSPPVMAPGESIRGQIHLELPKPTPVHSIDVCLTGTVTALDGARLGSMKTEVILEEFKTVATASITNSRSNTARRHTTPAPATPTATTRRPRGNSMSSGQDRAAVRAAAAAATGGGGGAQSSSEVMSRTFSMPTSSPLFSQGLNASTLSLNRSVSPVPTDVRGRRTSFSANVDVPLGYGTALGRSRNMSMVNISTIAHFPDDPSLPEAPSYDPPNYERIVAEATTEDSTLESTTMSTAEVETSSVQPSSGSLSSSESRHSPSASTDEVQTRRSRRSRRSNGGSSGDDQENRGERGSTPQSSSSSTAAVAAAAETVEPKAVLMQSGNYVIPFSIRIPSNTTISLPGSFSDPVGNISYQLSAVMKQILPSPDPYNPKALVVEPTFSSAPQVIKLIPMNNPNDMPLYAVPYETESVRANVGHWVWSTGFMEAHAWVPKQGYRPGRMIPLIVHIVNHSDARQILVETTLCKCLHFGSGLTKLRAMGLTGQPYGLDLSMSMTDLEDQGTITARDLVEVAPPRRSSRRRRDSHRTTTSTATTLTMPSPPASPHESNFSTTPTSEHGGESPNGSVHGPRASVTTSPNSMVSISSQWESMSINSTNPPDGPVGSSVSSTGGIQYQPEHRSTMVSPTPSNNSQLQQQSMVMPMVQHQREKMTKLKTIINCSSAVDREIQKTIMVPVPRTAGYSILNAPLLEVSYVVVVKIRAEKGYSRSLRLEVPIVVVVPEEGDMEEEDELIQAGLFVDATDYAMAFSGDEYDYGLQGECPPYEPTPSSSSRRRSRR
ncbi:Arrestin domain-containing protein 3 [Lunasporangiospora selenospora]|uniref:Arrestin domain-containing protein 3 n=1 Tax=Lunasporangiospora selenospora TaxID=979761 RepID=A0A9P6KHC3_9FUNG|nr:Arrestin domain-containing protein 3 [Lunasporangiospora selenospora]